MDDRIGEEVQRLLENALERLERLVLANAQLRRTFCPFATEFRIGPNGRRAMSRNVDFGDDTDAAVGGRADNLAHLGFRIARTAACQLRIPLAFKPPPLRIRQVPVKDVQSEQLHRVQRLLDVRDGEEVPRTVQHVAPPGIARIRTIRTGNPGPEDGVPFPVGNRKTGNGRAPARRQGHHASRKIPIPCGTKRSVGANDKIGHGRIVRLLEGIDDGTSRQRDLSPQRLDLFIRRDRANRHRQLELDDVSGSPRTVDPDIAVRDLGRAGRPVDRQPPAALQVARIESPGILLAPSPAGDAHGKRERRVRLDRERNIARPRVFRRRLHRRPSAVRQGELRPPRDEEIGEERPSRLMPDGFRQQARQLQEHRRTARAVVPGPAVVSVAIEGVHVGKGLAVLPDGRQERVVEDPLDIVDINAVIMDPCHVQAPEGAADGRAGL